MAYIPFLASIAIFFTGAFFVYVRKSRLQLSLPWCLVIIALTYVVALVVTGSSDNPDIANLRYTGELVNRNIFVYTAPRGFLDFHPYLPFQMFLASAAEKVSGAPGLQFALLIKLPSIAAVIGTAWIIRSALEQHIGRDQANAASLLYAINPITVGITAYHGQFDAIPAFFAVAAWFTIEGSGSQRNETLSALLLGLGVLSKTWPIILLPVLMMRSRAGAWGIVRYAAIVVGVPVIASAAYAATAGESPMVVFDSVRQYQGIRGLFGLSEFVAQLPGTQEDVVNRLDWMFKYGRFVLILALIYVAAISVFKSIAPAKAASLLVLAFLAFSPASVHHYHLWLLPFAVLARDRIVLLAFTGLLTLDLFGNPLYSPSWDVVPWTFSGWWLVGVLPWVYAMAWLLYSLGAAFEQSGQQVAVSDEA